MTEPAAWRLKASGGIEYYEFSPVPGLFLVFFTRRGGTSPAPYDSLNLSNHVGDAPEHVEANYRMVADELRLPSVLTLRQTHSDTVVRVRDPNTRPGLAEGDALFTAMRGAGLGVKVADCLPVYVWNRALEGIGIAHCGWRGTVAGIAAKLARTMSRHLSVPLPDLRFATGPCICPSCYEVGADVVDGFRTAFAGPERFFSVSKAGGPGLDIRAANRQLLLELGLAEAPSLELCTAENLTRFYSARRDSPTGRNLAVIAVRH